MPVIGFCHWVPAPVRGLEILKDDACARVPVGSIAPHVEVAPARSRRSFSGSLKPIMLVGSVIDNQLGDHAQSAAMSFSQEVLEIAKRPIGRVHIAKIRDVITVVLPRRGTKWQKPNGRDTQIFEVI